MTGGYCDQFIEHLRQERESILAAIRCREVDIARLNERLAEIERQIEKYETER